MPAAGDSRARDHLANERTFLAWLRTALAFIALGAALAGISGAGHVERVAAACVTVGAGLLVLAYGTRRFYRVQRAIDEGTFEVSGREPVVVAVWVAVASGIVLALLVVAG